MNTIVRRLLLSVALWTALGITTPIATVRADDQDYNTFWQDAASTTTPSLNQDYNAYWQQVEAQQANPQQ